MNKASHWRSDIAKTIAPLYGKNPKTVAVILGGSTARGHADKFSDMEMGVFWKHPPSDDDRQQVVDELGADLIRLYDYDPNEKVWSDDYMIGRNASDEPKSGILVEITHYRASFMERTLKAVLKDHSTDMQAHNLIAGVVDAIPMCGMPLVKDWQLRAATYPDELAVAMVNHYGIIDHFWRWEMYLHRSQNLPMLYQSFSYVHQRLLHVLLGLNRVYYFGFKWLDVVVDRLDIKPDNLLERLQQPYQVSPDEGAKQIIALVDEVFDLVEHHLPDANTDRLRSIFHYKRPTWEHSPLDNKK